jgi:hypothetical protein
MSSASSLPQKTCYCCERSNFVTRRYLAGLLWAALAIRPFAQEQKIFTATEARLHIGTTGTVCGNVMSTRYLSSSRGQPTFLDIGKPSPKQEFSVMIAGADRAKFGGSPEVEFRDKVICVTGQIRSYQDGAQIIAADPKQIEVQGER